MNKYNYFAYLAFITLFALISCEHSKKAEESSHENHASNIVELTEAQVTASNIEIGNIEMRSISRTLKVNGEIATLPQNSASVSMPIGGRIRSVKVMPGSSVRKGQVLAIIENPSFVDLQQDYLETKSKMEYTSADYTRQKELYRNEAASHKNLQLVTSEYKILKIRKRALEEKLQIIGINPFSLNSNHITRNVVIKAPISGYIKTVNVNIGRMVSENDILFDIIDINNLFIKLTIFEKDIDKIHCGQNITFYINDETEPHEALVYQTSKSIDEDKTYKVYASIRSKCYNVLPGMYVNARISSKAVEKPALPNEAIVNFDGKSYIFVYNKTKIEKGKKQNEYRMVEITKGISDGVYTHIVLPKGIDTNRIVVKGAYSLLSAMKNSGEMSC